MRIGNIFIMPKATYHTQREVFTLKFCRELWSYGVGNVGVTQSSM